MELVLKSSSQSKIRRRPGVFTAVIPKTAKPKRHLRPSLPQNAGTRVILTLLVPIILSSAKAQQPTLIGSDIMGTEDRSEFGTSVSLNETGNLLVAGAPEHDWIGGYRAGMVGIYEETGGVWTNL